MPPQKSTRMTDDEKDTAVRRFERLADQIDSLFPFAVVRFHSEVEKQS